MKFLCIPLYRTINLADYSSNHNTEDKQQTTANGGSDGGHVIRVSTNGKTGTDNQGREETPVPTSQVSLHYQESEQGRNHGTKETPWAALHKGDIILNTMCSLDI